VKLNEVYRLLPALAGAFGIFILDLMTPLGSAEWTGYVFPLWYVFRLSRKPAVSLPLVALACTGPIVAGYSLSSPRMDAFISAVNRPISVLLLWGYTLLLVRVRAADEWLNTAQENLQHSEARFRVMADAALPLTPRHQTYSSNLLLKQGMI
jgi:hypothetical protein